MHNQRLIKRAEKYIYVFYGSWVDKYFMSFHLFPLTNSSKQQIWCNVTFHLSAWWTKLHCHLTNPKKKPNSLKPYSFMTRPWFCQTYRFDFYLFHNTISQNFGMQFNTSVLQRKMEENSNKRERLTMVTQKCKSSGGI